MIMIDQSKRLREPLRWGRREKSAVAVVVACLVLAAAGLGTYAITRAPARADCIEVTFPSTLGAGYLNVCGAKARTVCASPGAYRSVADSLREACRRAGFVYGP
ncbi:MAG TPA: hypothetical protein VGY76_08520 [Solirubrobacteraceae bacterium]|jgi:hypothetical protein|nr:hypothetical protein [Solirubrobacteraceae bacterium]